MQTDSLILNLTRGPLTAAATVDAAVSPGQTLLWTVHFAPATLEASDEFTLNFSAENPITNYLGLYPGRYHVTAGPGVDPAHPIHLHADDPDAGQAGALRHTLTAAGDTVTLDLLPDCGGLWIFQTPEQTATVHVRQLYRFATDGQLPTITPYGHWLIVRYPDPWSPPRPGVLTARARLYDADGQVLAESPPITLTLRVAHPGGSAPV